LQRAGSLALAGSTRHSGWVRVENARDQQHVRREMTATCTDNERKSWEYLYFGDFAPLESTDGPPATTDVVECKPDSGDVADPAGRARLLASTPERDAFLKAWGEQMRNGKYREGRRMQSRARYRPEFQAAVARGVLSEFYNTVASVKVGGSVKELESISAQVATDWRDLIESVSTRFVGRDVITKWLNAAERERAESGARRGPYPYGLKCYVARVVGDNPSTKADVEKAVARILRVPVQSVRNWKREVDPGGASPNGATPTNTGAIESVAQLPWGAAVPVNGGVQQVLGCASETAERADPNCRIEPATALGMVDPPKTSAKPEAAAPIVPRTAMQGVAEPDVPLAREPGGCEHETVLQFMAKTIDGALGAILALQEQFEHLVSMDVQCQQRQSLGVSEQRQITPGAAEMLARRVHVAVLSGRYDDATDLADTLDASELSADSRRALARDLAACGIRTERI